MSASLEEAYVAVERAYGQGDFAGALQLAEALQPQIPAGRPDLLDQRLQLLLGHIHLYGLQQPLEAATAYNAVLESCTEPSYRELAGQGLEISRQHSPAPEPPAATSSDLSPEGIAEEISEVPAAEPTSPPGATATAQPAAGPPAGASIAADEPLPATPWLDQLQNPQQALQQIQQAWASATPAEPRPAVSPTSDHRLAATPWQPAEATIPETASQASTDGQTSSDDTSGADTSRAETSSTDTSGAETVRANATDQMALVALAGERAPQEPSAQEAAPADAEAIIPVVVTVEDGLAASAAETAEVQDATPGAERPPAFNEEEWADFMRGTLLVELTTSNAGPSR